MPQAHDAFISYSHSADGRLAPLLEAGLERLARPTFKLRAMNVFRDQTGLAASPGLWSGIVDHLEGSRWFVLLACPASAASLWCGKEVLWWLAHRGVGSMLVVLTDGEIAWDAAAGEFDWTATTALAPSLAGHFPEEPLFVDLRWARQLQQPVANDPRLRAAALDLAAPIRGVAKDELDGDDVRQLRRTRLIARAGVAAIAVAALVATWQAIDATRQRKAAEEQRDRALSRQLAAQANEMRVREPVLALLLAAQAPAAQASPEAGTALLRVLKGLSLERVVGHSRRLFSLAVQAGHDTVALGDAAGSALRLDPATGRIEPLTPPAALAFMHAASALAVSADGRLVASAGYASTITLWQAGAPLRKIETPETQEMVMLGLAFSPDSRLLASTSSTGRLLLHDLAAGTLRGLAPAGATMARLAFSPDGRWLAGGGDHGVVQLRPVEGGAAIPVASPAGASIAAVSFSADGRLLLCASVDGAVALYDARTGKEQQRIDARAHGELTAAALAPDGLSFVTTHASGAVQRWHRSNAGAAWRATEVTRHASEGVGVAFLADGRRIASAERNGRVFISQPIDVPGPFEPAPGRAVPQAAPGPSGAVSAAATSAGAHAAPASAASAKGAAPAWPQRLANAAGRVASMARNGEITVGGEAAAGAAVVLQGSLADPPEGSQATFSPAGDTLYLLRAGKLHAWDAASGKPRSAPVALGGAAVGAPSAWIAPHLALSADGRWLALTTSPIGDFSGATLSAPPQVTLYRAESLTPVGPPLDLFAEGFTPWALSTFTPDRRWLLGLATQVPLGEPSAQLMTVIDVASAQRLEEPLPLPESGVPREFVPGSARLLFSATTSSPAMQIDLRIEALAAHACRVAGRSLTPQEWRRYVSRELPYRPACTPAGTGAR